MMNILYADDERGMLDVGKEFLEMSGMLRVETAISAKEALGKMSNGRFDAIVSDYQMPGMDGLEFLNTVRVNDKQIPFILFTGKGREEIAIEAINSGVDFYIKKGGEPMAQYTELANAIHQAIARRNAERAQLEVQDRYRSLCNDIHSMVYSHDLEGRIIDANPAALNCFGYDLDDVVGMNVMDLLDPDQFDMVRSRVEEIIRTGIQSRPDIYRIRRKDGTFVTIETTGSLLYHEGKPCGICGIARDISERERAAEAIAKANKEIGILSGFTLHNIQDQTILLKGLVQKARKEPGSAASKDYLARIQTVNEKIQSYLTFAREYQTLGKSAPSWNRLDGCLEGLDSEICSKYLKVELDVGRYEVYSDALIGQVFTNLVDNTVHHGRRATRIHISAWEHRDTLIMNYLDDGVGVATDQKAAIFEKGQGMDRPRSLLMVREILAITGMTIEEKGIPGQGVRFEIRVPAMAFRKCPA
jgi:PAS domain S-box-containing protein